MRPDLDLDGRCVLAQDCGVERPIEVVFRIGDIVVELTWERMPFGVYDPKGRIAVLDLVDEHAKGEQVVDILHLFVLLRVLHDLLVDAVDVFGAARYIRSYARGVKLGPQYVLDTLNILLTLGSLGHQ
jgi:hypothetical protein